MIGWDVVAFVEVRFCRDPFSRRVDPDDFRWWLRRRSKLSPDEAATLDLWVDQTASWWANRASRPASWEALAVVVATALKGQTITDESIRRAAPERASRAA